MGKIISSRDGKSEDNIYYLHEVKKVEGGVYNPGRNKRSGLCRGAATVDRRAADRKS